MRSSFTALAVAALLAGCSVGNDGPSDKAGGSDAPVVLRLAYAYKPQEGQPDEPALRWFAARVEELSGGAVRVRIAFNAAGEERADIEASVAGMVREDRFVDPDPPARPRVAVLCPDPSAGMCLVANGFPRRFDAAVAGDIRALPAGVPVVILHDASVPGCRFAMRMRQTLAGRPVLIAGLRPSMVMSAKGALLLRSRSVDREALDELRGWLTGEELAWLGEGWWVPLASVPPAKLLTATARALRRSLRGERDQRRAEQVGFLSWPGS
jgi:hypothetical protein